MMCVPSKPSAVFCPLFRLDGVRFHWRVALALGSLAVAPTAVHAWGSEGHKMVSELALKSLPGDFPAFVKSAPNTGRIAYLANLPDRWRNVDPWLAQSGGSWTDHYLDVEQLADAGLDARAVSSMRLDFAVAFAAGRAAHVDKFPPIDPAKNLDHTREWAGFSPWAIAENFHRLQSAFGCLKAFQEVGGTAEEITNAEADIVYAMGVLAHYVGDAAQPLHTTIHHDGWVGPNPNGYTTEKGIHSWIDSGLIAKSGVTAADLASRVAPATALALPVRADQRDPIFVAAMDYFLTSHTLVEPLYQLEKAGRLGRGDASVSAEGRALIEGQLLRGGGMLGTLWVTAWKTAPVDSFLRGTLGRRQEAATGHPGIGKESRP